VDLCAGVFYATPERRSMTTFSPSYFPDLFSLVVFTKGKPGPLEMLVKVFSPFSPLLWVVIASLSWGVGFAMWMFGEVPDKPPLMGSIIGMRQAAMQFLGQGREQDAKTKGGRIVILGFSFMCMLGAASYTANLSSFILMSNLEVGVTDISYAIEKKKKVCVLEPLKDMMLGRYPKADKIMVWVSWFDEAMEKMDAGECQGMLLNENEYARMFGNVDFWGKTGNPKQHCGKMRVGDVVLSVPLGFPIRREIEKAIGYVMVKSQVDGILSKLISKYPPPDPECDHVNGLKKRVMALEPSDLVGVIILTLLMLGLGCLAHCLECRARLARGAREEVTKEVEMVKKEVTKEDEMVKKHFSRDKRATSESSTDADAAVKEGNFKEVHGVWDDMPKVPPLVEWSNEDNNEDEGHRGQSQDLREDLGRQVGFLTEVVCRLREDVMAVQQHLGMDDVDRGMKLASYERTNGAVQSIKSINVHI